jgi:phosphoribosylaminoimidazole-succinocarboxamide synthase
MQEQYGYIPEMSTNAALPPGVANSEESMLLMKSGMFRIHQGKVRDTFALPGKGNEDKILVMATDRISAHDFDFDALIPGKGQCLNFMTVFWLTGPLQKYPNHLLAYGRGIDEFLLRECQRNTKIQSRSLVVKRLNIIPVECVERGRLTGGGLTEYKETGEVCGNKLPPGLKNGSLLSPPIFTPSTKEPVGHDKSIPRQKVLDKYGPEPERLTSGIFKEAVQYAEKRGIILADTKFEFGYDENGILTLADEVLTPDSSRLWDARDAEIAIANGTDIPSLDKEPFRRYLKTIMSPFGVTVDKLDPQNPEHLAFVHGLKIPDEVIYQTSQRYKEALKRLTLMGLPFFRDIYTGS